jgi:hypothetical protein
LKQLSHTNERLVHQNGEQAVAIDFLKKLEEIEPAVESPIGSV